MSERELSDNINSLMKRITAAASKTGRDLADIKLVAVTKTVPADKVSTAITAGLRIFGESRIQEAKEKIEILRQQHEPIEWHFIGHLQKNKAKTAVELFNYVHSVDSFALAEILNRYAMNMQKKLNILIEVKLSDEEAKHGIIKSNLMVNIGRIRKMQNLSIQGLMTIPPYSDNPEMSRPYFRELRRLRDEANEKGFDLRELSMGMTNDFVVAIEEGATMVRIGTALFGNRRETS